MSARLPVEMDATLPAPRAPATTEVAPQLGRAYRARSLAARSGLVPTILVMVCCLYGRVTWTVYISMTRSFLLPIYKFAGAAQYDRLFATPRWQVAYGNMFLFGALDIIGTLGLGVLLAVLLDRAFRFEGLFRTIMPYRLSIPFISTGLTCHWVLGPPTAL